MSQLSVKNVLQPEFEGKVALVTGAASGMGLTTAQAFAHHGAAVVLADINLDAVKKAADELTAQGFKALAVQCNVASEEDVKAMVDTTVEHFGRLDMAFNNAGVNSPVAETADADGKEFDRIQSINLRGVWNCLKYELIVMRKQGSGSIVNCSSIGGLVGIADRGMYHATKHGVIGLTKSAALEYAARNIRINAVCPGIINTPMVSGMLDREPEAMNELLKDVPSDRLGLPEEIASAVLWLCSPGSAFVIGQALAIDGGYTVR